MAALKDCIQISNGLFFTTLSKTNKQEENKKQNTKQNKNIKTKVKTKQKKNTHK